ncbi:MAG: BrxA family protein [Chloroflexota bacterium]
MTKYTSKIIKAGALLPDTKMLLEHWDLDADVATNLQRMLTENLFGKASRSRIEDILAIFRQRYLTDPGLLRALVTLVRAGWPSRNLDPVLYYLSLRSDTLLHDVVTEVLVPRLNRGRQDVTVTDISAWLIEQVAAGRTESSWSAATVARASRELMATLRDFGILEGKVNKHISPFYLPIESFAFIAFLLGRDGATGERLINDPEWQVFFLSSSAVERFFLEAHQEHLLEYRSAGRVVRVEFPAQTPEEYALALAQRTH